MEGQKKRPELEPDLIDQLFRMISRYVSLVLIRLRFTPNSVTSIAILCSIIGGYFLAHGNASGYLIAAFFFFLFLLFDYCDGEMARTLNMQTISGHYFDYFSHFVMFASFMIGLFFSIYQYHPSNLYLFLGLCGISGIFLRSIVGLLIPEVIIRENLRLKKLLPHSNKDIIYSVATNDYSVESIKSKDTLAIKKIQRILLSPTGGDGIAIFYIPFSIIFFLFPNPIINKWDIRFVDFYFMYIFLINTLLPFVSIYFNIHSKKPEKMFNNIFSDKG